MTAALYWWRASRRAAWRQTLIVVFVCGILGAVSLAALAGARRTESAYGRYLASINASTVSVNIPREAPENRAHRQGDAPCPAFARAPPGSGSMPTRWCTDMSTIPS